MWASKCFRYVLAILATLLLGGLLSATLVRFAPGFETDEQQLDPRLSAASVAALRAARTRDGNIVQFYFRYLERCLHGDFGRASSLNQPVRRLMADRLPITARLAGLGLLTGWVLAFCLAVLATATRSRAFDLATSTFCGAFVCIPVAVMALFFVLFKSPAYLAVALAVFPKLFRYTRNLLARSYEMPYIITARAKGLRPARVLFWHVLPISAAPLLALVGVSVSLALTACIPIEALCGIPGIGELAWRAALGRDLPLLVTLTVLVTVITLVANSSSDLLTQSWRAEPS